MYYTKYRPQKFSEISRPNETADALMTQSKSSKISHAYLFIGPRGTGKTTTARILAKAINCSNVQEGDPCGECEVCKDIQHGKYLDLIEIDAASNRGIDDIRDLKEKIKLAPSQGKNKVYIIDEVHMLTTEAFNALLKTLEEPPSHAIFVLCTTESHKVPDTIKSRCQTFKFKRASAKQIAFKLSTIAQDEKIKISEDDILKIAKASLGGFRDAETMLQQVGEGSVSVDTFLLGSDYSSIGEFINCLILQDSAGSLNLLNSLIESGVDPHSWASALLKYLRDLLFISADSSEGLLDVTDEVFAVMEEQASKVDPRTLVFIIENFIRAQAEIKLSVIPQLPLEIAIVKVCNPNYEHTNFAAPNPKNDQKNKSSENETKPQNSKPKEKSTKPSATADLALIEESWPEVLKAVAKENSSLNALLKTSKPLDLKDDCLVLEVYYAFHKERIEATKSRKVVEGVLSSIYDQKLKIQCKVSSEKPRNLSKKETGELTDYNVSVPSPTNSDVSAEVFDGALPF